MNKINYLCFYIHVHTHELKYLGVYVDDALSWRRQVEHVSARCARAIGRLWRNGDSLTLVARRSWNISMPGTIYFMLCIKCLFSQFVC